MKSSEYSDSPLNRCMNVSIWSSSRCTLGLPMLIPSALHSFNTHLISLSARSNCSSVSVPHGAYAKLKRSSSKVKILVYRLNKSRILSSSLATPRRFCCWNTRSSIWLLISPDLLINVLKFGPVSLGIVDLLVWNFCSHCQTSQGQWIVIVYSSGGNIWKCSYQCTI